MSNPASNEEEENGPEPVADEVLVARSRDGDMGAFEELVARHRDRVYSRALQMVRNEEDAVDLSQQAWVRAWRKLDQFKGDSRFTTWLTRIAINLCLDHLRKRKNSLETDSVESYEETGGVERFTAPQELDPLLGLEREELRQRINAALDKLSDNHRTVLVLHEFEQMEYKKIAETLQCSIGTVMSRLFYARRKMASLLTESRAHQ